MVGSNLTSRATRRSAPAALPCGVDARDLTSTQLEALLARVGHDLDYYRRLRARMEAAGWSRDCPAYMAAAGAERSLVELHESLESLRAELLGMMWNLLKGLKR